MIAALAIPALADPPKVVKTIPANNDQEVDPNQAEFRVVFDQPMNQSGQQIVGSGATRPQFAPQKEYRWEDEKTLVCPWKLEPNHEYSVSINSATYKIFKSENGEIAVPYPVSFKTSAGKSRRRNAAAAPESAPAADAAAAADPQSAEPKVVSASPDNGVTDVDPSVSELRVVFDQPMNTGGMSIVGGGPKFPKLNGTPKWENDRTIVAKWTLLPNHHYWLSINNATYTNFRGTNGVSAKPYPIEFSTGPGAKKADAAAPAAEPATAGSSKDALAALKKAIEEDYSYRDLRKVNWSNLFKEYGPRLEASDKNWKFANEAALMLGEAKDLHMWMTLDGEFIPTFRRTSVWNVASSRLPSQVPGWIKRSSIVSSGRFDDGIRYLFIRSFPGGEDAELEPAFDVLKECAIAGKPLIIDVRANGGGSETLAQTLAGCFVQKPVAYAKDIIRKGGKFSEPYERTLEPNKKREYFGGQVVVLAGPGTVSSAESFVMMMKQAKKCTLIGQPTAGASGNPQPVDLGNGVTLFVPSWQDLRLDGTCLEGEGFAPDIVVKTGAKSFEDKDPVIEAALKFIREQR